MSVYKRVVACGGITSSLRRPPHSGIKQVDAQDDRAKPRRRIGAWARTQLQRRRRSPAGACPQRLVKSQTNFSRTTKRSNPRSGTFADYALGAREETPHCRKNDGVIDVSMSRR